MASRCWAASKETTAQPAAQAKHAVSLLNLKTKQNEIVRVFVKKLITRATLLLIPTRCMAKGPKTTQKEKQQTHGIELLSAPRNPYRCACALGSGSPWLPRAASLRCQRSASPARSSPSPSQLPPPPQSWHHSLEAPNRDHGPSQTFLAKDDTQTLSISRVFARSSTYIYHLGCRGTLVLLG